MHNFIIESGILKSYTGKDKIVIVPSGVRKIGGDICDECKEDFKRKDIIGDPIGYKAFWCNNTVEELYLPDSVETIGFKSLEHCKNLKVLAFSNNIRSFGCNSLLGCNRLKKILFRGTMFEFSLYHICGALDLDEVVCSDGTMTFHREYYIDTLYFPGTIAEWEANTKAVWLKQRVKNVCCYDGMINLH